MLVRRSLNSVVDALIDFFGQSIHVDHYYENLKSLGPKVKSNQFSKVPDLIPLEVTF